MQPFSATSSVTSNQSFRQSRGQYSQPMPSSSPRISPSIGSSIPRTSSPLSQSPSTSASSTLPSPDIPSVRRRSRYPGHLGRVPLHRRGTSGTYETLEDLLREAGYKETRIFSPDTEGNRERANNARMVSETVKDGVGAVVGFLANLVPSSSSRSSSLVRTADSAPERSRSPPASPSPDIARNTARQQFSSNIVSSPISSRSTTPVNAPQENNSNNYRHDPLMKETLPHVNPHNQRFARPSLRSQPSVRSIQPQSSRAHAYLRHMASAPNIQRQELSRRGRPPPLPLPLSRKQSNLQENAPPLPPTWFENITRAMLFGSGGSGTRRSATSGGSSRGTRSRHLNESSATSAGRNSVLSPAWAVQATASRPETSISHTLVVCRSAPASRSSSQTRPAQSSLVNNTRRRGSVKKLGPSNEADVPSLARTRVENDVWALESALESSSSSGVRGRVLLNGLRLNSAMYDYSSDDDLEPAVSDEEEAELDLAQILVPPKRQQSIRSLRKHLHAPPPSGGTRLHGRELRQRNSSRPSSRLSGAIETDEESEMDYGRPRSTLHGGSRWMSGHAEEEEDVMRFKRITGANDGRSIIRSPGNGIGNHRHRAAPWAS